MDFITLLRILLRRWYLVVPAVGITVFIGVSLVESVEPEFEADSSVVLYVRDDRSEPGREVGPRNPFATTNNSVDGMAVLLDEVMSDPDFRQRVEDAGLSPDYTVEKDEEAPILKLTATSPTRQGAITTANELVRELTTELDARQDAVGASPEIRIEAQVLTLATTAAETTVARNRAIVSVVVAGLIVVIGLALVAESLAGARERARVRSHRSRARTRAASKAAPEPPEPDAERAPDAERDPAGVR